MHRPEFFHLGSGSSTYKLAEWAQGEMDLEPVVCPADPGHQRPGKRLTDLSVTLPRNSVDDIVWTWCSECLLTDRVLELFRAAGLTGFEVKPVKARYERADTEPPRLWELVVTGWAGMAPPDSGIKLIRHCEVCGIKVYSGPTDLEHVISPSQWDGSDFFIVWPMPKFVFITDRVVQAIRDNGLAGAMIEPPEAMRFSPDDTIGGGRLSYWMPEQRARELGEPLGIY
jgi:uncharacterized protein CXXCG